MVDNLRQFLQADFITIHSPKFMIPNIVITNILNLLPFKKKKKLLIIFHCLLVHGQQKLSISKV